MAELAGYPFVPRSNRRLTAGQYWALPRSDGRFACGRVMAVPAFGPTDRIGVVIGLMDWLGETPPTAEQLAGRPVLEQAKSRFEAIANTGYQVLGIRPLDLDGLVAVDPDASHVGGRPSGMGVAHDPRSRRAILRPVGERHLAARNQLTLIGIMQVTLVKSIMTLGRPGRRLGG
jgi:hypothetical protein